MSSISSTPIKLTFLKAVPLVFFAFMWGSAEGAFFFIVPDVLLTYVAIKHGWRRAMWCAIAAAFGALEGGVIMYLWSLYYPDSMIFRLERTTAISRPMIDLAYAQMRETPFWSMLIAGFTGMPFKLYAAGAPQGGVGLGAFMLACFPIRLLRFSCSILGAAALTRLLDTRLSQRAMIYLWAAVWVVFYALYWSYVG